MARLIKKENFGQKTVVHIEVLGEVYYTKSGIISHNCKYCKQMYHDPNNIRKPRPYKLSQLAHGYFKPKLWDGKTPFDGAHPNCRHTMTMVAPGFTFNEQGVSDFKSFTHDYYIEYYNIHKSEEPTGEPLIKAEQFMDYDEYLEWSQNLENPHKCHEGCNH